MDKAKLISCISLKENYKSTKKVREGILANQQNDIQLSIETIIEMLKTNYIAQPKLYALRYLKDCFEQGSPSFISKTQSQILPILQQIALQSIDPKPYEKYQTNYPKKQDLEQFKSILFSIFQLSKQCIKHWSKWVNNTSSNFILTYQKLVRAGVIFDERDQYFREENKKYFQTNFLKNKSKSSTKIQNKDIKPETKSTKNQKKQTKIQKQQTKIGQKQKVLGINNINKVIRQFKQLLKKPSINKKDLLMMENKFQQACTYYINNTPEKDFNQNQFANYIDQFQSIKKQFQKIINNSNISKQISKQKHQKSIIKQENINTFKIQEIQRKEEKKKMQVDLSSIEKKHQQLSDNTPLKQFTQQIKFQYNQYSNQEKNISFKKESINTSKNIISQKITAPSNQNKNNQSSSLKQSIKKELGQKNHQKNKNNKIQQSRNEKIQFDVSSQSQFDETFNDKQIQKIDNHKEFKPNNNNVKEKLIKNEEKQKKSNKQIGSYEKQIEEYKYKMEEKYKLMERQIFKLKEQQSNLLLKLKASVDIINSNNKLKKQLFQQKKKMTLQTQKLNQLQQKIIHVQKIQDNIKNSNNLPNLRISDQHNKFNPDKKLLSFDGKYSSFREQNEIQLQLIGKIDFQYVQNMTHLGNLSSWINQHNILLFKKNILNQSKLFYQDSNISIKKEVKLQQQDSVQMLTITLNFKLTQTYTSVPTVKHQNIQQIDLWTKPVTGNRDQYIQEIVVKKCFNPLKIFKSHIKIDKRQNLTFLIPILFYSFLKFQIFSLEQFMNVFNKKQQYILKSKVFILDNHIINKIDNFTKIIDYSILDNKTVHFCMSQVQNDKVYLCQIQILKNQKALIRVLPIPLSENMNNKAKQLLQNLIFLYSQKC